MASSLNATPLAAGGGTRSPADEALHVLLASMACTDGTVHDAEVAFLAGLRPELDGPDAVRQWALAVARPVDLQGLPTLLATPDERWKCLRFVARMAWKDGRVAEPELALLAKLAQAVSLPENAVDRVLREMAPTEGGRHSPDRILKCVLDIHWDAVQLASGDLVSPDLVAVTPPTEVVARIGLEKVELMALCVDGLAARFQEGPAFLRWSELVTYSRGDVIGVALRLHVEDGRSFTLVDGRLAGLALVLDRLLDPQGQRRTGAAPRVEQVRGGSDSD